MGFLLDSLNTLRRLHLCFNKLTFHLRGNRSIRTLRMHIEL